MILSVTTGGWLIESGARCLPITQVLYGGLAIGGDGTVWLAIATEWSKPVATRNRSTTVRHALLLTGYLVAPQVCIVTCVLPSSAAAHLEPSLRNPAFVWERNAPRASASSTSAMAPRQVAGFITAAAVTLLRKLTCHSFRPRTLCAPVSHLTLILL